jgi:hypothetical protein
MGQKPSVLLLNVRSFFMLDTFIFISARKRLEAVVNINNFSAFYEKYFMEIRYVLLRYYKHKKST